MSTTERAVASLFLVPFVLLLVGLLLFMALINGQRDLTVLSLIVIAAAAGAKLWTRYSLVGIKCYIGVDKRRVFRGGKLILKAAVENKKILPLWLQARVPVNGFGHRTSTDPTVKAEAGLLWYQRTGFRWELAALRRGVYPIGPLGITVGDLFGFFPKTKVMTETLEVLVYPRLVPLKGFKMPRRDFFGIPGVESPVQDPVYILGTRDYQHGRPAKTIHWKATARHHKLQEKIFESSVQEKILLVVDVDPFARRGAEEAFERMLETVASVAVWLAERGCVVGLLTNARMVGKGPAIVPVSRKPQRLTILLDTLARVQMEPVQDILSVFRNGVRMSWGISCLYFAIEKDEATRTVERYFMQRRIPFVNFSVHPSSDPSDIRVAENPATQGPVESRARQVPD